MIIVKGRLPDYSDAPKFQVLATEVRKPDS